MIKFCERDIIKYYSKVKTYSTIMVILPEELNKKIQKWSDENIPNDCIFKPENKTNYNNYVGGKVRDCHISIKYGLHTKNIKEVENYLNELKKEGKFKLPIKISLGEVSKFSAAKEYDVIKIAVESEELKKLNKLICDHFEYTDDFPYKSHVTLAYTIPNSCDKLLGKKAFENSEVTVDKLYFSVPDEGKKVIKLSSIKFSKRDIKKESAAETKFWISPEGKFKNFSHDYEHKNLTKELGINRYLKDGWVRGESFFNTSRRKKELCLNLYDGSKIEWALQHLPSEYLFCDTLVVDIGGFSPGYNSINPKEIPVNKEEGEDALEAFKNFERRKNLIHASIKSDFGSVKSFWISPDYKIYEIGKIEHAEAIKKLDKNLANKNKITDTELINIAILDGWTRIGFWQYGFKGPWLDIQLGQGKDIRRILNLLQDKDMYPENIVIENDIDFDVNEDNNFAESYDYAKRRKYKNAAIKLSYREIFSYAKFGRLWLKPNGEEIYIKNLSHDQYSEQNIDSLYPEWLQNELTGDPSLYLIYKGWSKIWNDSIITTENGMKNLIDFIIKNQHEGKLTDKLYISLYKNDLSSTKEIWNTMGDYISGDYYL